MKNFKINNTKIANSIRANDDLPGYRLVVSITPRDAKHKIKSQFVITEDLSYFEMAVADAIYSLFQEGVRKFTPRKVLTLLSGDETISVPRDRKHQVECCIDKLIRTQLHIYCPKEVNICARLQSRYDGAFLNAVKVEHGYQFQSDAPMPLYSYGDAKRQLITIPFALLEYTPLEGREKEDRIGNSNENILLKQYLLHKLELVRNPNNSDPSAAITFKGRTSNPIFAALEIDPEGFTTDAFMNKKREIYRKTELLLNFWTRIGYLKGFDADKKEYSFHIAQDMICPNPAGLGL